MRSHNDAVVLALVPMIVVGMPLSILMMAMFIRVDFIFLLRQARSNKMSMIFLILLRNLSCAILCAAVRRWAVKLLISTYTGIHNII